MAVDDRTVTVHELWPLLIVADIERSIAFYRDQLGFSVISDAKNDGYEGEPPPDSLDAFRDETIAIHSDAKLSLP